MASSFSGRFARLALAVMLSYTVLPALATARIADGFTYTVCPSGCDFTNVQDAIIAADVGDTISIGAGTYSSQLVVPYNLTFVGAGVGNTFLDGGGSGPIMTISVGVVVTVSSLTIQNGSSANGGGVYNRGILTLQNSSVYSNTASYGGGVYNTGTMTVTGSTLISNSALLNNRGSFAQGGAIYTSGTLVVLDSTLVNNSAVGTSCSEGGQGGAIYNAVGGVTLTGSTVTGNSATVTETPVCNGGESDGGGVYNLGSLTVSSSTLSNNTASGGTANFASGLGGAVYAQSGSVVISGTTISGNTALQGTGACCGEGYGGGVYNSSSLLLVNSTVGGNAVTGTSVTAGGIYNVGTLGVTNSTISDNSAGGSANATGGGLAALSGGVSMQNTILSKNIAPGGSPDCAGSVGSDGYNLVGNTNGCTGFGAPGDQVNVGAHLGPLQNNGGPTLTMAPLPGSPAIDAVAPSSCTLTTDQRAQPRPDEPIDNGFCDVGAVEVQEAGSATSTPTSTPTPTNTPLPPTDTPTNTPPPATNTPTSTPTPVALLGVSPASGVVGQAITLSGANYGPSETVNIYADIISPPSAYTATANISGTFTLKSTVKQGTYGVHTLIGVGKTSTRQASTLFTIKAGMSLKPASGVPGTAVTATDTGFGATETVTLHWKSATGTVLGTGTSNSLGKATVSFTVPGGSAAGRYRVYAIGATTKAQAVATFTVT